MKKWGTVTLLACAQFVMVLDSTVMNVSMSTVATDLGTSIGGIQSAITFYTLTMAALMMTGGKMGDKWGRLRAFRIGAIVYALGSLLTALSTSLLFLMAGWSLIEGLGAVLVLPAIAALVAAHYSGRDRVTAYAIIGGVSGAAAAAGPLIGGFLTTYLSWRYVFAGETVIMLVLLFVMRGMRDIGKVPTTLDVPSVVLSAAGMAVTVFAILQSKVWGWVTPRAIPEVFGHQLDPFGISIVAYLLVIGVIILRIFYRRQQRLEASGGHPLVRVSMFAMPHLRAGLATLMFQYLITAALFFVIPVYLQMVLGKDALATGVKIIPLSVGLILFSIVGSRLAGRYSPKRIIRIGQGLLVVGGLVIVASINTELRGFLFGAGMFFSGAGLGLLASQVGNVIMSSVKPEQSAEAGGLQGTSQNLGSSLGTALIGSVLIASLTTGFTSAISESNSLPASVKQYITSNAQSGVAIASAPQVEAYAISKGVSAADAADIAETYKTAEVKSLRESTVFIAVLALVSLLAARNIPDKKVA